MASICFYFQVHQPFRLGRYSFFSEASEYAYFDEVKNGEILRKVAQKCYLPATRLLATLIERHEGRFKFALSLTGLAVEQMERYCPEALQAFVDLSRTRCVEFLGETYYHSLAALYSPEEFREQVQKHSRLIRGLFGVTPKVFRNTELIYDDSIGQMAAEMGFKGVIAEGVDDILDWRSPNFVYRVPNTEVALLLKNYRLSDDIAFRFSNRAWAEWPLTPEKFASWVHEDNADAQTVNLFMDLETFGEHQWETTGIFDFLEQMPALVLEKPEWNFKTPSEVIDSQRAGAELHFNRLTSWADVGRDISAWRGNRMQHSALEQVYALAPFLKTAQQFEVWRKLLASDHFYYMSTKLSADGVVHAYFSPYESPYDAFINFMNVLRDFREMLNHPVPAVASGRPAANS